MKSHMHVLDNGGKPLYVLSNNRPHPIRFLITRIARNIRLRSSRRTAHQNWKEHGVTMSQLSRAEAIEADAKEAREYLDQLPLEEYDEAYQVTQSIYESTHGLRRHRDSTHFSSWDNISDSSRISRIHVVAKSLATRRQKKQEQDAKDDNRSEMIDLEPSEVFVIYSDEEGEDHRQPLSDMQEAGTLIDPETGSDMPIIGASIKNTAHRATDSE